jgi:hypothetical protein
MRYKETKGRLPFMKDKPSHGRDEEHLSHSPASSDHNLKTDKVAETVLPVPKKTGSN